MERKLFMLPVIVLLILAACKNPANPADTTDTGSTTDTTVPAAVLPEKFSVDLPVSLRTTSRPAGRFIAGEVNTQTMGQEVVVYSLQEIKERSSGLAVLFAMMNDALDGLEGTGTDWIRDKSVTVTQDMIDRVYAADESAVPPALESEYTYPDFIYADEDLFETVIGAINAELSENDQVPVRTAGYDKMLVLDELTGTPQTRAPIDGAGTVGLLFILWNDDSKDVAVYSHHKTPEGELFRMEYDFDSATDTSTVFYYNRYLPDGNNPDVFSTVTLAFAIRLLDAETNGVLFDFTFSHVRGDTTPRHNELFRVQGYADDSGGYTEAKRKYVGNVDGQSYDKGLLGFDRFKEQFNGDGDITSVMGFSTEMAHSMDDWFVLVNGWDPDSWMDSWPQEQSFAANRSSSFYADLSRFSDYVGTGEAVIAVKLPRELSWDAAEFEKWFVITESGKSATDWSNVLGLFGVTQDDYAFDPDNCIRMVTLGGLTAEPADVYCLQEITADTDSAITGTIETAVSLNTATGYYEPQ